MCSPHARGWTAWDGNPRYEHVVFPARAGMDRSWLAANCCSTGVPRTRGDGPAWCAPTKAAMQCSPHARGWTGVLHRARARSRVFPARAGMDRYLAQSFLRARSVPRTRGDGPRALVAMTLNVTCSPHARGWTGVLFVPHRVHIVFPARAGMDRAGHAWRLGRPSVPRTRGDGPRPSISRALATLCSPHARGWTVCRPQGDRSPDVFPARAGMDR